MEVWKCRRNGEKKFWIEVYSRRWLGVFDMGNPHPTKSKPVKIGRKHTSAMSLRQRGNKQSAAIKANKEKLSAIRQYKALVSAYWLGRLESFPHCESWRRWTT